jgi:hypothetical protein
MYVKVAKAYLEMYQTLCNSLNAKNASASST